MADGSSIVSSDIVGYQQITIPTGYSLFTVTFKEVAGGEYDVQNIKVLTTAGADYTANNKVKIQKLASNGDYGSTYNYRLAKGGWCNAATYIGTGVLMLGDGEGFCVYNGDTTDLLLQVSGAVNLAPSSLAIASGSYMIIGNMTPVAVDIQDVVPYIGDEVCSNNNKVKIQKLATNGDYGPTYNYRKAKGGWCNAATYLGTGVVTLNPGESLCVYNGETESITLKFPSPIE